MSGYRLHVDGSCAVHTTRCGGYAALLDDGSGAETTITGHVCDTTSQRMELQAVIAGLGLVPEDAQVLVYTDSQYAYHAILGDWCVEKNDDLIVELYLLLEKRHVSACYIPRGSTREQKRVDREAKTASQDCPKLVLLPDKNQQKSHS